MFEAAGAAVIVDGDRGGTESDACAKSALGNSETPSSINSRSSAPAEATSARASPSGVMSPLSVLAGRAVLSVLSVLSVSSVLSVPDTPLPRFSHSELREGFAQALPIRRLTLEARGSRIDRTVSLCIDSFVDLELEA